MNQLTRTANRLRFLLYLLLHRPAGFRANAELLGLYFTNRFRSTQIVTVTEHIVLNLRRSRDRLQHMHELFAAHGLGSFTRFKAIDGSSWSTNQVDSFLRRGVIQKTFHKKPALGNVANWLSHKEIFQYVVKSNHEWVFVLEDDVEFINVDQPAQLRRFTAPRDAELIFANIEAKGIGPVIGGSLRRGFIGFRTTGYLLSRRGAEKILASPVAAVYHTGIDTMLWWLNRIRPRTDYCMPVSEQYPNTNLRIYCLATPIIRQSDKFESTVDYRFWSI